MAQIEAEIDLVGLYRTGRGNSFIESVSLLPSDPPLSASIFQLMKFAKKYLTGLIQAKAK